MAYLRLICLLLAFSFLSGCVKLTLAWADLAPDGVTAEPAALDAFQGNEPVTSTAMWEGDRAPALREAFEANVYGVMPEMSSTMIVDRRVLDEKAFGGLGHLEEYVLQSTATFSGVERKTPEYIMNVVLPANSSGPVPVILIQTFCPRWDTMPHPEVSRPEDADGCGGGMSGIMTYIFGRYIATPPLGMILERGYGVATIFPSEIVPDRREEGLAALANLAAGHKDADTRWGAIAAWGWAFSRMADVLLADDRIDPEGLITFGHSRYGKSALFAAAYDDRIDGVVSHQSGTGGASLNRKKKGESVRAITNDYPHWFSATYAAHAGREEEMSVDQHQLLALIAPRPVLLGNARRDVWSDPNGAFRAAIGADPVYELYGEEGLTQDRLNQFKPEADLSFWIRPGTHGIVKEDWPAFLEFLDAHFKDANS